MGGAGDADIANAGMLQNKVVNFASKVSPGFPQRSPGQQSPTPSYWDGWEDLPNWLKPDSANPWYADGWGGHAVKLRALATGAHIFGQNVASALMNHYLYTSGSPYYINSSDVLNDAAFMSEISLFFGKWWQWNIQCTTYCSHKWAKCFDFSFNNFNISSVVGLVSFWR